MAGKDAFIKFNPERLLDMSAALDRQYLVFKECCAAINREAGGLGAGWKGEGAEAYARKIGSLDRRSFVVGEQLRALGGSLAGASGIYGRAESAAALNAGGLPVKGVFSV